MADGRGADAGDGAGQPRWLGAARSCRNRRSRPCAGAGVWRRSRPIRWWSSLSLHRLRAAQAPPPARSTPSGDGYEAQPPRYRGKRAPDQPPGAVAGRGAGGRRWRCWRCACATCRSIRPISSACWPRRTASRSACCPPARGLIHRPQRHAAGRQRTELPHHHHRARMPGDVDAVLARLARLIAADARGSWTGP